MAPPTLVPSFTHEERMRRILSAEPAKLAKVDQVLLGADSGKHMPESRRLMTIAEAARQMAVSRSSIYRLIEEKRLPTIPFRRNRVRIREADIIRFISSRLDENPE